MFVRVRNGTALINVAHICVMRALDSAEYGDKWYEVFFTSGNVNLVMVVSEEDYANILEVAERAQGLL